MIVTDALTEAFGMVAGRQRMTANLHLMATRALSLSTRGLLTNEKVLTLLRPATTSDMVDRDTGQAGNLCSAGTERGLWTGDLNRYALSLISFNSEAQNPVQ